ncbi:MAG TPA: hypothetical protein VHC18_19850 [Amycolatopsis sp.]|nr:hypothetical protein [Amycolatopsis sp.]
MAIVILVLVGLASLVVGVLVDNLIWVYAAAALSALALVAVAFGAWRRRRAVAKAARETVAIEPVDSADEDAADADEDVVDDHPAEAAAVATDNDGELDEIAHNGADAASPSSPEGTEDEVLVRVISGRKRFHLPGCPLAADGPADDVTLAEARDEGFSPCTRCMPAESVA